MRHKIICVKCKAEHVGYVRGSRCVYCGGKWVAIKTIDVNEPAPINPMAN